MSGLPVSTRSLRLRVLAVIGAAALAWGVGATPANAAPGDPGSVTGTVTDSATHLGIAGIGISLSSSDYSVFEYATTDADGAYSIAELPLGDYTVFASAFGLPYQFAPSNLINLSAGQPAAVSDFALVPYATGSSTISGVATNTATGDPVSGASISIQGVDVAYNGSVATDGAGGYSFTGLAEGTYFLSAWAPGFAGASSDEIALGTDPLEVNFALTALDATISGRVTGPHGVPVSGLWVGAYGSSAASAQTDSDGNYTLTELPAGEIHLQLGGNFTPWVLQDITVTAVANSTVTRDVQLTERKTSTVLGLVFGQGYTQGPGVCVDLLKTNNGQVVASTVSWLDSTYSFENVKNGTYTLSFEDCDATRVPQFAAAYLGGATTLADATTFTIAHAADDIQVEETHLLPAAAKGSITLTIRDAKTDKLITKGVKGTIIAVDGNRTRVRDVGHDGVISFADLELGDYTVTVNAPGYEKETFDVTLLGGDADITEAIFLDKSGKGPSAGHPHGHGHDHKKPKPHHGHWI